MWKNFWKFLRGDNMGVLDGYNFSDKALKLIQGGYDVHIHPDPSHFKRNTDDFELMQKADALGMAGVMLKSHYDPTGARARLANKYAGAKVTKAYGGVALNWPVGGLNPYAVECNFKMGGTVCWMPTRDTANCLEYGDMPGDFFKRPGIRAFNEDGKLKNEIYEILEIIRKYNGVLGTGHFYLDETLALCDAAADMGVKTVLTHPEWNRTAVSIELQKHLVEKGIFVEKLWENVRDNIVTAEYFAYAMKEVGYEHCIWGTDGAFGDFDPIQGIMDFIDSMAEQGIPDEAIRIMLCENAPKVLEN